MILVVVSIDTEVDHRGDSWVKTAPLRFTSVVDGIRGPLAGVFRDHGVRPSYLLTTEVMDDPQSVDVLRHLSDVELGTHLHGDHAPPEARLPDPAGTQSWDFTCCYSEHLERAKLQYITEQFHDRFDALPRSYRAGRYAASGRTASMLCELGYSAETSVTPGIRWVHEFDADCVLDFRGAAADPYRPSSRDLARKGTLPIWEVPITVLQPPRPWTLGLNAYQRLRFRPLQEYPVWLRPSTTSWPWLRWVVNSRLRSKGSADVTVFNVMFHSMEIVAGASPYSPTPRAARRVLGRLNSQLGARFLTLSELVEELERPGTKSWAA